MTTVFPKKSFIGLLFLLVLLSGSLAGQVWADDDNDDDETSAASTAVEAVGTHEVRWYQVELLVFRQKSNASALDEVWPKDISLGYPEQWESLKTPEQYEAFAQKGATSATPFILLEKNHFQLDGFARNLRANHNDILFHAAWKQPLTQHLDQKGEARGTTLLVNGGSRYDNHYELEGSVTLSLQRYLHINTNLWLSHFVPATNADSTTTGGWPALPENPLLKAETNGSDSGMATKQFVINEIVTDRQTRRMRSHETHYLDHPKLGIAIRFTPLDASSSTTAPHKKK
jgi:hypothetical protein